jgi:superfamily II DNA or RNA helicase
MSLNIGYIYIRDNYWYKYSEVYKVGITTSIKDRNNTYITGELYRGFYCKIYELNYNNDELRNIDNELKIHFKYLNIYFGGGTEFYNRTIINYIEDFLIQKKIDFIITTEDELDRINRDNDNNNDNDNDYKKEELRDYQIEAISHITEELKFNNKCYLHLATGAGKSKIAINVISNIQPLNIIIFSPRITIKNQNISDKYLEILDLRKFKYNIYSYCYQSYKNVYNLIQKNNINEIFIWFDESHWALDNWILATSNEIKQFFIKDNSYIKYRLFTTASPNKEFILENKKIYGEIYEPIKFKDLQEKGYLAKIEVEIFDKEIEKESIEYNNLIFNTFNKPKQERKMGFSFHNTCNSAYLSYLYHLKEYNNKKIDIKPYLLINEDFIKKENFDNNDNDDINEVNTIKRIKKEIGVIDYYNEISSFEKEVEKTLGYVVAKYSIGYDNKNIDIIYFTDPKLSYKDIIQSIGRGTRINGNKILRIILPTNSNNEIGINYKKIENVLKYLLLEIELEFDKIKSFKSNNNTNLITTDISNEYYCYEEDIDEKSPINTMKHNIIVNANEWTTSKIIKQLKYNNIHTINDYISYSTINKNINLPDINELLKNKDFNFRDTYNNECECPYYYNKKECIEVIKSYRKELRLINRDNKKLEFLISVDPKIPNMPLWYFYGNIRDDYF